MAAFWYEKAAHSGNVIAMHNLGLLYLGGHNGINKDHNKAFELFKKSAKEKYSNGIIMLGACYEAGIGTNVDMYRAFELYQEVAKLGNSKAQYNLAIMYEFGYRIEKDLKILVHRRVIILLRDNALR